jgi:hypothetical protein
VAELWEEARSMHHCAEMFAKACAIGLTIIVSVRDRQTARRVATARIDRTSTAGWQCIQVRGFANRDPDPRVMPAVRALVAKLDEYTQAVRPAPQAYEAVVSGLPAALRLADMPRTARPIGWFEWSRSGEMLRGASYRVSLDRSRRLWLLWATHASPSGTLSEWRVCAYGPRRGTKTAADAGALLLAATWRRQRESDDELSFAPSAYADDLLTEEALLAVIGTVWSPMARE